MTGDGSHTLRSPATGDTYHSMCGAIMESMHVYIHSGLEYMSGNKSGIRIFEMGFGTGLNALLTLQFAVSRQLKISYHAVDDHPIPVETAGSLNYPDRIVMEGARRLFHRMHDSPWDQWLTIHPSLRLYKERDDIARISLPDGHYDLVYFDAFGPDYATECWTYSVLERIYHAMRKDGVLVTYSCKGAVRRDMVRCGFRIEKIPAFGKKRHMIRAIK